jgi:hypothetical protein
MRGTDRNQLRCWQTWEERLRILYGSAHISTPAILALLAFTADVQQKGVPIYRRLYDSKSLKVGCLVRVVSLVLSTNTLSMSKRLSIILNEATYYAVYRVLARSRREMNDKSAFEI